MLSIMRAIVLQSESTSNKNLLFWKWDAGETIRIQVKDDFDNLDIREQYSVIVSIGEQTTKLSRDHWKSINPQYGKSYHSFDELFGYFVFQSFDQEVYLVTSSNEYRYYSGTSDSFGKNGKSVSVKQNVAASSSSGSSSTPSSTPSSGSSASTTGRTGSTSVSSSSSGATEDDPLHASDYRQPEDFYEDHWDDFFDFYDAETYWRRHH